MATKDAGSGGTGTEAAVKERYAGAAGAHEVCLCAPVSYDRRYLEAIPTEIIEKDYGCGDPSKWLQEGETVLDLGSGSGKICYIASQIVGSAGRVIGVDFNEPMLELARKYQADVVRAIGHDNVTFFKGRIQDLALDLERLESWLAEHPVTSADDYLAMSHEIDRLRRENPMIPDDTVDCIVSNCVLNLVKTGEKTQLFEEMFRVLKPGGRCVISDIVSDEDIPQHLQDDPDLWSGCISGSYREDLFLEAFEAAGFQAIEIVERQADPWQTVEGIEFRSVTVRAIKGDPGPCLDQNQAAIYKGPWKAVVDDCGQTFYRGDRMAICGKTFEQLSKTPYADQVVLIEPLKPVSEADAGPFECGEFRLRPPQEMKGRTVALSQSSAASCCTPESGCC